MATGSSSWTTSYVAAPLNQVAPHLPTQGGYSYAPGAGVNGSGARDSGFGHGGDSRAGRFEDDRGGRREYSRRDDDYGRRDDRGRESNDAPPRRRSRSRSRSPRRASYRD
jgi:hypothetical protein